MKWIEDIREYIEPRAFGVCTYLGERLGMSARYIRLFFIYATFIATWSPIIIYMVIAFWVNLKAYVNSKKSELWDM